MKLFDMMVKCYIWDIGTNNQYKIMGENWHKVQQKSFMM